MTASPFPAGTRVAGYVRDSGGSRQELSTDQQVAAIEKHCGEQGLLLTRLFRDDARSGGATAGRDQFLAMVDYMQSAPEVGVLIWSYARFARQYDDLQLYTAILRKAGKIVYSLTDPVPEGLEGRLLESIYAYKDAKFRVDMARDVRRGQRYVVEVYHAWPFGPVPAGYQREPIEGISHRDGSHRHIHRLVVNPETAPAIVQAFNERAAGATYEEIMHAHPGLVTYFSSIAAILRNKIYLGIYEAPSYRVEQFCQPLVDAETWEQVQIVNKQRQERTGTGHPRRVRSSFLLSGLLHCGVCGRGCTGANSLKVNKLYRYYVCTSRTYSDPCQAAHIPATALETIVLEIVRGVVLSQPVLDDIAAEMERLRGDIAPDDSAERRLRVQNQIDRVLSAIRDAGHSPALLDELRRLETQLSGIRPRAAPRLAPVYDLAERVSRQIDADPRSALRGLVSSVTAAAIPRGGVHGTVTITVADVVREFAF